MKTIVLCIALFAFTTLGISANNSVEAKAVVPTTATTNENDVNRIVERVKEIQSMDIKKLNSQQKSELRKELKAMKKSMAISGGVYIGGTALIVILIVLIILLA